MIILNQIHKPMTNEERIKADAQRYTKDEGYQKAYIAGATAESEFTKKAMTLLKIIVSRFQGAAEMADQDYDKGLMTKCRNLIEQWKGKEEIELSCMVCGTKFMGPEPQMCCSGRDCGCMGMPIEPIVCSKECYDKGIPPQRGSVGTVTPNPCPHCGKELHRDRNLCCRECGKEVGDGA